MTKFIRSSREVIAPPGSASPVHAKQTPPSRLSRPAFVRENRATARIGTCLVTLLTLGVFLALPARSQRTIPLDSDAALKLLDTVAADIQEHYYDPNFHGVDWKATVAKTRQQIEADPSLKMSYMHIGMAVNSLNDPHTYLGGMVPRDWVNTRFRVEYGLSMEVVGDKCYIARVFPGTDAEAKGVRRGDELVAIDGSELPHDRLANHTRGGLVPVGWHPGNQQDLTLRDPSGHVRQIRLVARGFSLSDAKKEFTHEVQNELNPWRQVAREAPIGTAIMILKLSQFIDGPGQLAAILGRARKHPALIVDLRGNPAGASGNSQMQSDLNGPFRTLEGLVGGIFEQDVKIANRKDRTGMMTENAKSQGRKAFKGRIVVLIDSTTAAEAELFARVVQIQKRGLVLGDSSAGSVMQARYFGYTIGDRVPYGITVTEADLIMSDGKSLERAGVTPDEIVLPTGDDLANNRDPALSRAATLLGVTLSPEDAGKLFPYVWEPQFIPLMHMPGAWGGDSGNSGGLWQDPMPRWHPGPW